MTPTLFSPAPLGALVELALRGGRDSEGDRSTWPEELVAADLQVLQRRRARDAAVEAELILALAGRRPATTDPSGPGARRPGWTADGEPEISEFFLSELSAILNLGRGTASHRLGRALTWTRKLPATFAALRAGRLDERRADALADVLAHTSREIAGQVEDALLSEARDLSVYRLRDRATALMLQLDTAAAEEQRAAAERVADVHVHPAGAPGRSTLAADLPTDEAVECHDLVDQLARMLKADGDERPIGVLRAYVLSALIRRPADSGLPLVSADVRITAGLDSLTGADTAPGEVNGLPITAAHLRELLARVGALGLTAPEGGTLTFAVTGPDGQLLATTTPAELARLARRGCTAHPDGDSERGGGDRAAHDGGRAAASCGCPVLGPPAATDGYAPTDKQRAFVTSRDQRCRFPNCGQRVGWADLDHVHAHGDGGTTDCTNLCCLCRSHHRLKTFAPGWRFHLDDDGTLHVTTPSGVTRTTRPPGLRPPAESPPGLRPPGSRPLAESPPGLPRPVELPHETPAPPVDDPPPF